MNQRDLEALLTEPQMSEEEKELRVWLKLNAPTLRERYDPFEVVHLALMNGFDDKLVYGVIVNFQDAMNGTHIDNRIAMSLYSLMSTVERVQAKRDYIKELDLRPLWKELFDNQISGDAA